MNDLNSVLVEGTVVSQLVTMDAESRFDLALQRFDKGCDGEYHESALVITVAAPGKVALGLDRIMMPNARIRVIGRLQGTEGRGKIVVRAEHIEHRG